MAAMGSAPVTFAHRGARAHAPENTIEAFVTALRMGATGVESDVWVTADGVAVLDHDGVARCRSGRRSIADTVRGRLSPHIPELADLYATCGTDFELSLDVKDVSAVHAVLHAAEQAGALDKLWLCHPDWKRLAAWRRLSDAVHLVDSSRLGYVRDGPRRRAARLVDAGIEAVNLHHLCWTRRLVDVVHDHGLLAFGWDAQGTHALNRLVALDVDAIYSDHVDRMTGAVTRRGWAGIAAPYSGPGGPMTAGRFAPGRSREASDRSARTGGEKELSAAAPAPSGYR